MSKITIRCSSCGKKLLVFDSCKLKNRMGPPIKYCKKCGNSYIDPRFYEPAIDGISNDYLKISPFICLVFFGAFAIYRGYHLFGFKVLGEPQEMQYFTPVFLICWGAIMTIIALFQILFIITGKKKQKYEEILKESKERIEDPKYIQQLMDLGYIKDDK